jgi:pentatricopeptide repeat protein
MLRHVRLDFDKKEQGTAGGLVNMILYSMVMHQSVRRGKPHEAERLLMEMIRSD